MTIKWSLKKYVYDKHGIHNSSELKKHIALKTGVTISLQNICNLMNNKPTMIRLETMEIICTAFECNLVEFCQISSNKRASKKMRKLSFKNTPNSKRGLNNFPSPEDY